MSHFDDSPHEMHDDSLTPDVAERLFDGEVPSPEFADLVALVDDVRNTTASTATPEVRGALAEFVGLTAPAKPPRRRSVIAEAVTFAGTLSGKLLIGGSLAAASVTGAQATGLVDLPLVDKDPATVVVTDDAPNELPLEDWLQEQVNDLEEAPKPEPVEPAEEEPKAAENPEAYPAERVPTPPKPEEAEEAVVEEAAAEEKADEPVVEEKTDEKHDDKAADDKDAKDEKKDEDKSAGNEDAIAALQAQLLLDKEAVYAAATALMQPIEAEKKVLVDALNEILAPLEQARNDAKAPLYAELETTTDPDRKVEIEAELSAIYNQWVIDRDAAAAAANPAIAALDTQLTNIEIDRDAEISRLLEQFQLDVDALG